MPESRQKYLYERLGDHDFQQLVGALLTAQFADYVPMALRQADGGRDGILKTEPGRVLVYQVKWFAEGKTKDSVATLSAMVRGEAENLRRLAKDGVRRYILVTNVPSTSKPGTGTLDRLDKALDAFAKEFGFEQMTCVWREGINAWVDNATTEIKWAYADMLAGWDLVRYLVAEQVGAAKDSGLRDLVRKVVAAQWAEDEVLKFSQAEVDREKVADLYVDVTAEKLSTIPGSGPARTTPFHLGGAAKYLLTAPTPFNIVRGAPGQGKSTLSQYVCQAHRNAFMPEGSGSTDLPDVAQPRFPLRLDLSDYARWLRGGDPWLAEEAKPSRKTKRSGPTATIEAFLADLVTYESGGVSTTAKDVQAIFQRVPSVVVLDGLDEVGSASARQGIVRCIDEFVSRGKAYDDPPKVIVTTRPSAGELAEPSTKFFEVLALNPLTVAQRDEYLRKWCAVRGIRGKDGRALRASFREKTKELYIEELAGNPMQLTILLDLLHQQGAATPTQRTDLYDHYVGLLLAREANKHPASVRKHRDELTEIVPFIGWYLQAHTEESGIDGRMSVADLMAAMRHFQKSYGRSEDIVGHLFEAATDRLWALTSKLEGTYEFEVQSLREYFAARFLYLNAGESNLNFDKTTVLRELLRRPYWLNTARFYGGNAKGSDIYILVAGIEAELASNPSPSAVIASWTLLTDAVFLRRPPEARKVLTALCADHCVPILLRALDRNEISALPELPQVSGTGDDDPTWTRLTGAIEANPSAGENRQRVRVLRELLNQKSRFATWWATHATAAAGTATQDDWLRLAAECEAAAGVSLELPSADLRGGSAELFLNTGAIPTRGSDFEKELLQRVFAGQCCGVASVRSYPAQVASALSPANYFTSAKDSFFDPDARAKQRRADAINALRKSGSPVADVAKARAFKVGQKGSTFPWANSATSIVEHVGPCWLAVEVAIIGAASPLNLGYTKQPGKAPFGPQSHPAELLAQTRQHADDISWWTERLNEATHDSTKAEWALALWAVASGSVMDSLLSEWEQVVQVLDEELRVVLVRSAVQIAEFGWLRDRPITATSSEPAIQRLLELRGSPVTKPQGLTPKTGGTAPTVTKEPSLLSVARSAKWLKVDTVATYR